jgi:hypothetical protein
MFCGAPFFGASFFAQQYAIQALVVAPERSRRGDGLVRNSGGRAIRPVPSAALSQWTPAVAAVAAGGFRCWRRRRDRAADRHAHARFVGGHRLSLGLDEYKGFFEAIEAAMRALLLVIVVVGAIAVFSRVRS